MSRFNFNEPYEFEGLEPQQIRDDFMELIELSDPEELLRSLMVSLPTDAVGEFIDNRMMGRV